MKNVGINPTMCMQRIELEEGARPVRESQRRLNPTMQEVVKKELLNLLKEGIICNDPNPRQNKCLIFFFLNP